MAQCSESSIESYPPAGGRRVQEGDRQSEKKNIVIGLSGDRQYGEVTQNALHRRRK